MKKNFVTLLIRKNFSYQKVFCDVVKKDKTDSGKAVCFAKKESIFKKEVNL